MKKDSWKSVSIILIIVFIALLGIFLIKGLFNQNYISLTKLQFGKADVLNNLLKLDVFTKKFKKQKIKMTQISEVLWAGYGKTIKRKRTVLSLLKYPLNLYICVDNKDLDYLKQGVYQYRSSKHNLKRLSNDNKKINLLKILKLKKAPVILVVTANDGTYQKDKEKVYFETGQAIALMLLKIKQLELKAQFINNFDMVKIINAMDLKEDIPVAVMLIGN